MKNIIILSVTLLLFITGCSSGGTQESQTGVNEQENNVNQITEIKNLKSAVNNLGNSIEKDFDSFTIRIESNIELSEADTISNDTKAVYGKINGKSTKALLKLNSNYNNGYIVVKVYDEKTLVGQSQKIELSSSSTYDFGSITTN